MATKTIVVNDSFQKGYAYQLTEPMGRRLPEEDQRQIKRWKAIRRHVGAVKKNCRKGDFSCRPRQRKTLLHRVYDSRKM